MLRNNDMKSVCSLELFNAGNQLQVPSLSISPYSPKASVSEPADQFHDLIKRATIKDTGTQTGDEYVFFSAQARNSTISALAKDTEDSTKEVEGSAKEMENSTEDTENSAEDSVLKKSPSQRESDGIRRKTILRESSLGQLRELYMTLPLPDCETPSPTSSLGDLTQHVPRIYLNMPLPAEKGTPYSSESDLTNYSS